MITDSGLLEANVYHKRHKPVTYEFSHKVFYLILNLNNIKLLPKTKFFSIDRFNIFSLFWKNYGFKEFDDPKNYIYKTLEDFNLKPQLVTDILLITMPRILGYAFNPVSFWLCFSENNDLYAVLAEVNNTFGERHGYLCFNKNLEAIKGKQHIVSAKIFHVSPFCEVKGYYKFRFDISANKVDIDIDYYDNDQKLITTAIRGKRKQLLDTNLIKYFFLYPFMTLKVVFLIHYHALRLWIKKVRYIKKPVKPNIDIT